ncbi:hypothetical protein CRENBAI_005767 [Crenichthys baileyi]|uniref:Uncharacterized protein n=1 Tax=Crenichthys baileyi TaxID=28760 RepID=A0AAV9SM09_9TELE
MDGAVASLGDGAVADEDAGILAAAFTSAGRETTAPDVTAAMGDSSSPAESQGKAPRRRFLRLEKDAGLAARLGEEPGKQGPGKKAEKGAEPPHAPSAPAAVERAEPPDRPPDVSSPPPSAAEPSDPWRSPAYRPQVHVWRKHSVRVCVAEDTEMQMSRQHDGFTSLFYSPSPAILSIWLVIPTSDNIQSIIKIDV